MIFWIASYPKSGNTWLRTLISAYYYSKLAFENLPNNMPHFNLYMNSLVARKDVAEMNKSFETVRALGGDTPIIWTIYLRSLANVTGLGDTMTMSKAAKAFKLFPQDDTIFSLYRILTYGQQRVVQAEQLYKQGIELYNAKDFNAAFDLFKQAFDLDPLEYTYALNSGLALYENEQYQEAVSYLNRIQSSKKVNLKEATEINLDEAIEENKKTKVSKKEKSIVKSEEKSAEERLKEFEAELAKPKKIEKPKLIKDLDSAYASFKVSVFKSGVELRAGETSGIVALRNKQNIINEIAMADNNNTIAVNDLKNQSILLMAKGEGERFNGDMTRNAEYAKAAGSLLTMGYNSKQAGRLVL